MLFSRTVFHCEKCSEQTSRWVLGGPRKKGVMAEKVEFVVFDIFVIVICEIL